MSSLFSVDFTLLTAYAGHMLMKKKNVPQCSYGCCKSFITNKSVRKREKNAWQRDFRVLD